MRIEVVHYLDRGGCLVVVIVAGYKICGAAEEMLIYNVVGRVSEIDNVLVVVDVSVLVVVVAGLEVDAEDLHASCKSLVTAFLLTSAFLLFLIPTLYVHRHSSYLGRVHVI